MLHTKNLRTDTTLTVAQCDPQKRIPDIIDCNLKKD